MAEKKKLGIIEALKAAKTEKEVAELTKKINEFDQVSDKTIRKFSKIQRGLRAQFRKKKKKMSDTLTVDELKEAIEVWAPKFYLIRELWPGASIEESLSLMSVIEEKAGEIRDVKKNAMGFGSFVENKSKKTRKKAEDLP